MKSIWKGSISFGLINIPVKLYSASRDKEVSFVLLHKKDLSEIHYARICKAENKEVPWEEIVKGYEYKKGDFVILEGSDFEKAEVKRTQTIEIINFVKENEIDSVYYVKPYFLEPEKNSQNSYILLREALKKSKKVAIARYVLKNREHFAVIKPYGNTIILNELRYQTELLPSENLQIPSKFTAKPKEIDIAIQLIEQLTKSFNPKEYKDTYTDELKRIIKQREKGKPIHSKEGKKPTSPKVHDIMSLLQASLKKKPSKRPRKSA